MSLLKRLHRSLKDNNYDEAQRLALEIESSEYPKPLKAFAVDTIRELGRQQKKAVDEHSERLYQAVKAGTSPEAETTPSWLPWRIILDSTDKGDSEKNAPATPQKVLETYTRSYLLDGTNTLNYLEKVSHEIIQITIADFFDHEYYKESHEDMRDCSKKDALAHYAIHGGREHNRKPNRLFSNEDLYSRHPWTKQLNCNPLYIVVRWPEEFADITELISKRYHLLKNQIVLPWPRPLALTTGQANDSTHFEYQRIHAITKESSSKEKLITPNFKRLNIHIVIPDFTAGGGGHMTIFRMILHLEKAGHQCTVWIKDYCHTRHPDGPNASATNHYQPIKAKVLPLSAHFAFARGDAIIATSWDTVEIISANKSFHDYFYLVQDYEPYFYPRGSESLEAEHTYFSNTKTICASSWLHNTMTTKFGRTSTWFDLSYNSSIYGIGSNNHRLRQSETSLPESTPIIRIAFYARSRTARRAVSLALKGVEKLRQSNYIICIELFGEKKGNVRLPDGVFGHDNGILAPDQLAELYRSCDIGLTFSATNYALVPQEMMACGLAVIEIDNDSTRAIYPEGTLILAEPSAQGIADAIHNLSMDASKRRDIATKGFEWVQQTSWDSSFRKVESFICNEVKRALSTRTIAGSVSDQYLKLNKQVIRHSIVKNSIASVVIPTYQGGALLQEVIAKIQGQSLEYPFEIIIIDSGSTDGSIEMLSDSPNTSIYRIKKDDFQHGRTRNLGVSLSSSPYVAFLTQDSVPADDQWLSKLITPFYNDKDVVAAFGRHKAHPKHPNYLDEWLTAHFRNFKDKPLYRKSDDLKAYYRNSPHHRQKLHYYSDNNSCLRKSYWLEFPYPDISYGEDQLWADWVIQSGAAKAYAHDAVVYHSHDYTECEEYERAKTEAYFFLKYFGYELGQNRHDIEAGIEKDARAILRSDSDSVRNHKDHLLKLLRAKREGYRDGCLEFRNWLKTS